MFSETERIGREELDVLTLSMGPLNGLLFRFAKTRPGEGGAMPMPPNAAPPSPVSRVRAGMLRGPSGALTTRIFVGKEEFVGVAGSTFTLECGDLGVLWCPETVETEGETREADDVEEALECVWWWCGILRIDETELDVDFLPRRPPEDRR